MKKNIIGGFVFFIFIFGMNAAIAQSDYEIVQKFNEQAKDIEKSIKDSNSLDELNDIAERIEELKNDFLNHKELLNKSLYPDNFDVTLEKLSNSANLRKKDFSQVDVLKLEVTGLREQLDTLNRKNNELITQFNMLESQSKEDRTRLAQLEKTVSELRASIKKRDQVVLNIIDSLLPPSFSSIQDLNQQERSRLFSQAEKSNVISHIKRAIEDNIRFLEVTDLQPEDLGEIKDQQITFTKVWKGVAPAMVELYSEKEKDTNELKEIDAAFTRWHKKVNEEAWEAISNKFAEREINIEYFSNGNEFTSAVNSFINHEIKSVPEKGDRDAIISYKNFTEKVWYSEVEPQWMPFLIKYDLIEKEQKDTIEVMLASWRDTVYPGGVNWLLVVVGVIIIAIITVLFTRMSARRKVKPAITEE